MEIRLNGQPGACEPGTTVADLLAREGLAERRVAVEVNGEIVPRGRHSIQVLAEGDSIELVHALGGG